MNFTLTPAAQQQRKRPDRKNPGLTVHLCHYRDNLCLEVIEKEECFNTRLVRNGGGLHAKFLTSSY